MVVQTNEAIDIPCGWGDDSQYISCVISMEALLNYSLLLFLIVPVFGFWSVINKEGWAVGTLALALPFCLLFLYAASQRIGYSEGANLGVIGAYLGIFGLTTCAFLPVWILVLVICAIRKWSSGYAIFCGINAFVAIVVLGQAGVEYATAKNNQKHKHELVETWAPIFAGEQRITDPERWEELKQSKALQSCLRLCSAWGSREFYEHYAPVTVKKHSKDPLRKQLDVEPLSPRHFVNDLDEVIPSLRFSRNWDDVVLKPIVGWDYESRIQMTRLGCDNPDLRSTPEFIAWRLGLESRREKEDQFLFKGLNREPEEIRNSLKELHAIDRAAWLEDPADTKKVLTAYLAKYSGRDIESAPFSRDWGTMHPLVVGALVDIGAMELYEGLLRGKEVYWNEEDWKQFLACLGVQKTYKIPALLVNFGWESHSNQSSHFLLRMLAESGQNQEDAKACLLEYWQHQVRHEVWSQP